MHLTTTLHLIRYLQLLIIIFNKVGVGSSPKVGKINIKLVSRYQDKGYPEVNKRYVSATLSRPKSFGEHDMGERPYSKYQYHSHSHHQHKPPQHYHHQHYPDNFKSFFTDTVLQQKLQYTRNGYGKSWGTDMNCSNRPARNPYNTTSKSTGDIHSSHPAFITNSAMRQPMGNSFLMTTEL